MRQNTAKPAPPSCNTETAIAAVRTQASENIPLLSWALTELCSFCKAARTTLSDTRKEASGEWKTYSHAHDGDGGWHCHQGVVKMLLGQQEAQRRALQGVHGSHDTTSNNSDVQGGLKEEQSFATAGTQPAPQHPHARPAAMHRSRNPASGRQGKADPPHGLSSARVSPACRTQWRWCEMWTLRTGRPATSSSRHRRQERGGP